jgi:ectoine hydroxylase-related dioxygenase (phytanoyl-CoA dioxygenase family)
VEVHLKAGDALIFVDAIMHGAARRVNPGERRMTVYRYGPSWGYFRHRFVPSAELLARLTPLQRQIVMPHQPPMVANA